MPSPGATRGNCSGLFFLKDEQLNLTVPTNFNQILFSETHSIPEPNVKDRLRIGARNTGQITLWYLIDSDALNTPLAFLCNEVIHSKLIFVLGIFIITYIIK